ncbi:MAG: MotA/TolQ/ExbB proton channel family protein [Deltaproteobacteria bacterium]|nr:MAG: MotA/TolQ/ExbB proton channel family protein [Deltaproteobacteria bacterium]
MIQQLLEQYEGFRSFLESGGHVLFAILVVTLFMWTLLAERLWYLWRGYPRQAQAVLEQWRARPEHASWEAEQIQRELLSRTSLDLTRSLAVIKSLISVCPLLGLLGTVTGMIEVFDVMAMVGSGNTRAMAAGVFMATVPTMAGMVAALSGMYFSARLDRQVRRKLGRLEDEMKAIRGETCAVA